MAGRWQSRIERVLLSVSADEHCTVSQVAGVDVYAAMATLQTWQEPKPHKVRRMIEVLTVIGEALLPELDQEVTHGERTVREGERRRTVCQ